MTIAIMEYETIAEIIKRSLVNFFLQNKPAVINPNKTIM